ncbi:MAG: DUF3891 family protein [Capsulimonadales bacterium]|nr:DUF3891 family protein [Capsulimonadales bacterium]
MVVNPVSEGWEIVFHRAHALLATQIALRWREEGQILRVAETVAAIVQHDDLERELEQDRLTPAGAPMDFTLRPTDEETEIPRWQEMLDCALHRSRWVALLTGCHILFLNAEKREESRRLDRFLRTLEEKMERWREQLNVSEADLRRSYAFLQWCDRLSLTLVGNELPTKERWLEISFGPDGVSYSARRCDDGTIELEPWPFDVPEFTTEVDVRLLNRLKFDHPAALQRALEAAPVRSQEYRFRRSGSRRPKSETDPGADG